MCLLPEVIMIPLQNDHNKGKILYCLWVSAVNHDCITAVWIGIQLLA